MNDIVFVKSGDSFTAGQVWFLASSEGVSFGLVSLWNLRHHDEATASATWDMSDRPELFALDDFITSVIWRKTSESIARTLIPFELRGFKLVSFCE